MATGATSALAQPATNPGTAESAALDAEINRLNLSNLSPADKIVLAQLLGGERTRGDWLVRQAQAWLTANPSATSVEVDGVRSVFRGALPAAGGGALSASPADVSRWTQALNALKAAAKSLMDVIDAVAIKAGNWDPPTSPLTAGNWATLWGRGVDVADLTKLKNKSPQVSFPSAFSSLFKAVEASETADDKLRYNVILRNLGTLTSNIPDTADPIARNTVLVAIAMHGRALGADEALLNSTGNIGLPTNAQGWNDIAAEFDKVSAKRLAAMARQLAGSIGSASAPAKAGGAYVRTGFKSAQPPEGPCAVADIVRKSPGSYVAFFSGADGDTRESAAFSDAAGFFAQVQAWRSGKSPVTGLLIAPDRGMWPDAAWYQYCGQGRPVNWFAVIPSTGVFTDGSKWDADALYRQYCLHLMESTGKVPPTAALPSLGSALRVAADSDKKYGFDVVKPHSPAIRFNITGWESAMSAVKSARLPFLVCLP